MTKAINKDQANASVVMQLSFYQAIVSVVVAVICFFVFNKQVALSALLGGLIGAIANLFFAGRLFVTHPDLDAPSMVYRFYRSEAMKIVFTLSMFAICIFVIKVSILAFIIAYMISALLMNWLFLYFSAR